jgi:hypothetical protein
MINVNAAIIERLVVPPVKKHRHHLKAMLRKDRQGGLEVSSEHLRLPNERIRRKPEAHGVHLREEFLPAPDFFPDDVRIEPAP